MKLYLIRHAESEANAASDLDNPTYYYDARITPVSYTHLTLPTT